MYYIDPNIRELVRIFDQNKREGNLRLDLNENPGGLPRKFIEEALRNIQPEFLSQYPETLEFTQTLAAYLNTDIEHLCLVNGSAEGIRYVIEAFTAPGGTIVGVSPSYAMFEVYSAMYGRTFIPVHYTEDLQMPVERILDAMHPDVQLLILLNPNNPMGNVYSNEEMEQLLRAARENEITVLIDEAYHYFYPKTFINYALNEEHIFVTRTFSKLFSLAGCRLGYVAGWPEGIALVQKLCTPHNVNAFAMYFAEHIIQTEGMIESLAEKQAKGKQYLKNALDRYGYRYQCGEGNFIFIQPKTDAAEIVRKMKEEKRILIKTYSGIGFLGNCLRVTTGETVYMEQFMNALLDLDKNTGQNNEG